MVTASLCGRPPPHSPLNTNATQPSLFEGTVMEPAVYSKAQIRLYGLRRRPLNSNPHWPASAFHGRKNPASDTFAGAFLSKKQHLTD